MRLIPIIAVAAAFALAALLVGGGQMFQPSTALAQSPPGTPLVGYRNPRRRQSNGELGCGVGRDQLPHHLQFKRRRKLESCRV